MKTIHLANSNPYSSEFQTVLAGMCDQVFARSCQAKRIISCGAGVVILPDTDKKHDCGPGELAKALHLKEEMEKPSTAKTYYDMIISKEDDGENHFVKLSEEQYRLLEWLYEEGLLGSYVEYRQATSFITI